MRKLLLVLFLCSLVSNVKADSLRAQTEALIQDSKECHDALVYGKILSELSELDVNFEDTKYKVSHNGHIYIVWIYLSDMLKEPLPREAMINCRKYKIVDWFSDR